MAALIGRQFRKRNDAGGFESIFLADLAVRQSHSQSGEVTRHPVEDGGSIADHVTCEPKRLVLEMEVSKNPLCSTDPTDPIHGFAAGEGRLENAYNQLLKIKKDKCVFDVQTKLHLYRNMVIEGLDATQDERTCNVLRFSASLVEVSIVGSETIGITSTAVSRLSGPVNRGDVLAVGLLPNGFRADFCQTFIADPSECENCDDAGTFLGREECLTNSFGVISPEVFPPDQIGFGVLR